MQRLRSRSLLGSLAAAALVAAAGPLAAAQTVLVVDDDGGPGVDFTSISSAVAAAPDGSVVLVRAGQYLGSFAIEGRSLTLLADAGGDARIVGTVQISGSAVGETVTLRGFAHDAPGLAIVVVDCDGVVRLEDLDLTSYDAAIGSPQSVRVESSTEVHMARVRVGAAGASSPSLVPTRPAVEVIGSALVAYHSEFRGADGFDAAVDPLTLLPFDAEPGRPGLHLAGAVARLDGCAVTGGDGGDGLVATSVGCVAPGDGGDGVLLAPGLNSYVSIDTTEAPGVAGATGFDPFFPVQCPDSAQSGVAIGQLPGAWGGIATSDQPRPRLFLPGVVREDEPLVLAAQDLPGELLVWGASAFAGAIQPTILASTVFEVGANPIVFVLGVTNGLGQAQLGFAPLGDFLPAGTGLVLYHQVVRIETSGAIATGEPAVSALLDAGL